MNVFTVLPDLPTKPFANILPSLERNHITVADLLTLDAADVAKRAQIPIREARRLTDAILQVLHAQYGLSNGDPAPATPSETPAVVPPAAALLCRSGRDLAAQWQTVSLLDDALDGALGGGIPTGYVTEITGESGVGKTQLLLTLLLSVQLAPPHGLNRSALYISTEGPLQTTRLSQIIESHPVFSSLPADAQPTLSRILSMQTPDLEFQDHVLRYQVPVAIKRDNIGLLVIDSITANYRAELDHGSDGGRPGASMAKRSALLMDIGAHLRDLARTEKIAVVVANQVADRFRVEHRAERAMQRTAAPSSNPNHTTSGASLSPFPSQKAPHASEPGFMDAAGPGAANADTGDPLTLDHQQRWFSGWGDHNRAVDEFGLKTPSLGLIWTNQIACRIALHKRRVYRPLAVNDSDNAFHTGNSRWSRHMKLVFAPWAAPADGTLGVGFCIERSGLQAVTSGDGSGEQHDLNSDEAEH